MAKAKKEAKKAEEKPAKKAKAAPKVVRGAYTQRGK